MPPPLEDDGQLLKTLPISEVECESKTDDAKLLLHNEVSQARSLLFEDIRKGVQLKRTFIPPGDSAT